MTTITKYEITDNLGNIVDAGCGTERNAVLRAAAFDGWSARFERADENGNIEQNQPMRLFASKRDIRNNLCITKEAFSAESTNPDDDAAEAEVAAMIIKSGILHRKYTLHLKIIAQPARAE